MTAVYHFARTADDLADEGEATIRERQDSLARFEAALHDCAAGRVGTDWPHVFGPLAGVIERHHLPLSLLTDLLDAFRQDTENPLYADRAQLLDYCRRSAHPIGRLLLHLVEVDDAASLAQSDAICAALQLVNFWQDLSIDLPRGRCYVPQVDAERHGVAILRQALNSDASRSLVRDLCGWTRELMRQGEPLVHRIAGRFGWELRLVVQGGLRVMDKIEAMNFNVMTKRPRLHAWDVPAIAWRAFAMRQTHGVAVIADSTIR